MKRLQELCWNFGFQIVFPRLCLVGIMPVMILLGPGSIAWLALWPPWFDRLVLFGSVLMFTLSVASNLAISRFLHLSQTELSPYEYKKTYIGTNTRDYFRIQVTDRAAFGALQKSLLSQHPRAPIALWLRIDNLWLLAAIPLLAFGLVLWGIPWLLRHAWVRLRHAS